MPKGTVVNIPVGDKPVIKAPQAMHNQLPARGWLGLKGLLGTLVSRQYLLGNLAAFLLARVSILGEMTPFGLAFFAAIAQIDRSRAPAAGIWLIGGLLSAGFYREAAVYAGTMGLFLWLSGRTGVLERHQTVIPVFLFSVAALGELAVKLWQEAEVYGILTVLFGAAIGLILSFIFLSALRLVFHRQTSPTAGSEAQLCLAVLLAAAVAGLGPFALAGYSARNIVGSLVIMVMALAGGTGSGAAIGVAIGLVSGLSDGDATLFISLYAIAGLFAGAFRTLGKVAVMVGFFAGSVIAVLFLGQKAQLVQTLAESALAAGGLLVIPLAWLRDWSRSLREVRSESEPPGQATAEAEAKLAGLADIFTALATSLGQDPALPKNKVKDEKIAGVLALIGEQVCRSCPRRATCWEGDFYRTYQGLLVAMALCEKEGADSRSWAGELENFCNKPGELGEAVRQVAARNRVSGMWHKRLADTRLLIAEQLRAIGTVLSELRGELRRCASSGSGLAAGLTERAELLGCPVRKVRVSGDKGGIVLNAEKNPCSGNRECLHTLLPLAAALAGEPLTLHCNCGDALGAAPCQLTMRSLDRFRVITGAASLAKAGVCGDTCAEIPLERGKLALVISDGMGSGHEAAGESETAVRFLTRLLSVGFAINVAVQTVNSLLLLRTPHENFATIDMVIIDTCSGEAEFLKVGSAPSFLKRVREVTTIKTASLPVGIIEQIEVEPVSRQLMPGDIIVMVSDGVVEAGGQTGGKESWVANFLRRLADEDPQVIAERVLRQAVEMAGAGIRDDMTVVAARIVDRAH